MYTCISSVMWSGLISLSVIVNDAVFESASTDTAATASPWQHVLKHLATPLATAVAVAANSDMALVFNSQAGAELLL